MAHVRCRSHSLTLLTWHSLHLQIDPQAMDDATGPDGDASALWHQQAAASGHSGVPLGEDKLLQPHAGAPAGTGSTDENVQVTRHQFSIRPPSAIGGLGEQIHGRHALAERRNTANKQLTASSTSHNFAGS